MKGKKGYQMASATGTARIDRTAREKDLDPRRVTAEFERLVPPPEAWIAWLERSGIEATWRTLAGPSADVDDVPRPDYAGWLIQETGRVGDTEGGVLVRAIGTRPGGGQSITIEECRGDASEDLWFAARRMLATVGDAVVTCGEVTFTEGEWFRFLATGELPADQPG